MGGNLLTVQSLTHTHPNDDIFHGADKIPKHVEMVRTKCQPKIGTDKMPTTIKSWHFFRTSVRPAQAPSMHHFNTLETKKKQEKTKPLILILGLPFV